MEYIVFLKLPSAKEPTYLTLVRPAGSDRVTVTPRRFVPWPSPLVDERGADRSERLHWQNADDAGSIEVADPDLAALVRGSPTYRSPVLVDRLAELGLATDLACLPGWEVIRAEVVSSPGDLSERKAEIVKSFVAWATDRDRTLRGGGVNDQRDPASYLSEQIEYMVNQEDWVSPISAHALLPWYTRAGSVCRDRETGVEYLVDGHTLMVDWDQTGPGKTIDGIGDAYRILTEWCATHEGWSFDLYQTPNGARAFGSRPNQYLSFIDSPTYPEEVAQIHAELRCDPRYTAMVRARRRWDVRVSPKPGRANDYVARFVGRVGRADYVLPIVLHHDLLCKRFGGGRP